jgi:DNA-directed RNA polymerase subunit M/transcription elongation factor TFIIS
MTDLRRHVQTELTKYLGSEIAQEMEKSLIRSALCDSAGEITIPTWDHEVVRKRYVDKYRMIIHNLAHEACSLKDDLTSHRIEPDDACKLRHRDLRPDLWQAAPTEGEDLDEDEVPSERKSDLPCNNCARKGLPCFNTEYREFQTRAGDESTTIYAFCRTCKKRWKFSG